MPYINVEVAGKPKGHEHIHGGSGPAHRSIPIRDLTWNIEMRNHGPATKVRGTQLRELVSFCVPVTPRPAGSLLERILTQGHSF